MKSKPGAQVEDKGSGIDNDVFDMNDTGHSKNNPSVGEYAKGDPEAWNEGVNKDKVNKDDSKREETGHAPLIDKHAAQEAIASARRLEEKAVKAIIASQRMLPGATDEIIEKQAGILMHLPEEGLNATLANQEGLAQMIAKAAASSSEEEDEEEDASSKDAGVKKDEEEEDAASKDAGSKKDEEEEDASSKDAGKKKLAALKRKVAEIEKKLEDEEEASSKDAGKKEEEEEASSKDAGKKKEEDEEEDASSKDAGQNDPHYFDLKKKKEKLANLIKQAEELEKEVDKDEKKKEEEEEEGEEVEASHKGKKEEDEEEATSKDASLLDQIFSGVMPSPIKKGASKLSGMVKKEASSSNSSDLSSLWSTAPDVREIFN
jgi:hypothetical protein